MFSLVTSTSSHSTKISMLRSPCDTWQPISGVPRLLPFDSWDGLQPNLNPVCWAYRHWRYIIKLDSPSRPQWSEQQHVELGSVVFPSFSFFTITFNSCVCVGFTEFSLSAHTCLTIFVAIQTTKMHETYKCFLCVNNAVGKHLNYLTWHGDNLHSLIWVGV